MIAKLTGLLERSVAARVIALLVLYLLGLPVLLVVFTLVLRSPRVPPELLVFFFAWGIGAAVWLWLKLEHRPLGEMGFTPHPLSGVLVGLGAGALPIAVFAGLCWLTGHLQLSRSGVAWPTVALALGATALQSASEEVVFRGYCLGVIDRAKGPVAAIVASSVLFAALHVVSAGLHPLTILNLLLWAVVLALVMLRWRNLWLAMGLHIGWNWAQQHVLGFSVYGSFDPRILTTTVSLPAMVSGGVMGPEGSVFTTIMLAVLIFALLPGTRLRAAAPVSTLAGTQE